MRWRTRSSRPARGKAARRGFVTAAFAAGLVLASSSPARLGASSLPIRMAAATLPGTTQWIANQSVETDATGWSGLYNARSVTSRVTPGFDGSFSLRSVNKAATEGANGFSDKPRWLPGTGTAATVAGTVYTGSVWVKADTVGEKITLFLRELNAAGAGVNQPPYKAGVTVTATTTNWFNITEAYPAVAGGDAIRFIVCGSKVPAHAGFDADLMSLTSPGVVTGHKVKPGAPTNVLATAISQTKVNLSWTAATDNVVVTGYTILRDGQSIGTTTGTTYADTGLSPDTAYSYSIVATDVAGNAGPAGTASTRTPPALGAPTDLRGSGSSGTEVDLTWTAAPGATGYTIVRDGVTIGSSTATQFTDTGIAVNSTYSYVVIATDSIGGTAPSASLPVTTGDGTQPPLPPPPLTLCGNPAPASPIPIQHVIVVMLENHSYRQVVGAASAPYETSLAASCGSATAMFGATHTSAANYLAASAGEFPANSAAGCGRIRGCADASDNLYHQLDEAGLTWRSYQESMPTACSPAMNRNYKIGHNPALFYSDLPHLECQANDLPVASVSAHSGALWNDLQAQSLPSLSWVTPNKLNDGDTGTEAASLARADSWLAGFLATVQQSASYQAGNTLVLVSYDEGSASDRRTGEDCTNRALDLPVSNGVSAHQDSCHIPLFVVYPYTATGTSDATFFDLYSVTKTVEDLFALPYLAHAGDTQTTSLAGHFGIS